ncbi:MAG: transglycosylase domain-containing protein [Pseudomonadota bacterium]
MLRLFSFCLKTIFLLIVIVGITAVYLFLEYSKDLPDFKQLAQYQPPAVSRLYTADGISFKQFSNEYRIFTEINDIPDTIKKAFIAAEDKNFYLHPGIDLTSIARAVVFNLTNRDQRLVGGSTITALGSVSGCRPEPCPS